MLNELSPMSEEDIDELDDEKECEEKELLPESFFNFRPSEQCVPVAIIQPRQPPRTSLGDHLPSDSQLLTSFNSISTSIFTAAAETKKNNLKLRICKPASGSTCLSNNSTFNFRNWYRRRERGGDDGIDKLSDNHATNDDTLW